VTTPSDAIEFTFKFNLTRVGTLEDIAEFTVWCATDGFEPDDAGLLKLAVGAGNAWTDNAGPSYWSDNVSLATITARTFMSDGHTLREQITAPVDPWVGVGSNPALPWESSLVLSLYTYPRGTFISNGRRKRGRIYLPPMSSEWLDNSNSGYFSNTALPGFFANMVDFIGRVGQDDLGVKLTHPVVFSRVDGVTREITQLSIDAKIDVQRRRQNREVAGVLTAAYHE
jgi:hypothetical protein